PQTLPEHAYREMRLVTTAAGDGWLTYSDNDNGHDFALPLAAGEPAPPSPPAAGGGGGGATTPPALPATRGAGGGGAQRAVTGSLGHGLVGELSTPKECVAGGQIFKAKVAVKRKGSKAHKTAYTVKQVTFFLAGKKVATDKRKPFETSFATKGVAKGASLQVSAKINVIVHLGHRHSTVSKTLKTTVTTCR
ncbi:MAG: hypothetical protein J0H06_00210, partial [Actinobacteria bacterium]|nr:hypothetical protein [Actinomycetota bacterium]